MLKPIVFVLCYFKVALGDISPELMAQYCKITCKVGEKEVKHTVCAHKCQVSPDCVEFNNFEMSDKDRQFMLDLHNYHKNLVASGRDRRGGNAAGKNMLAMNYDKDIEVPTLCWSRRCEFEHDSCRHSLKYTNAGQNIYLSTQGAPIPEKDAMRHINSSARAWYSEIVDTTKDNVKKFGGSKKMIGHFTQMIWSSTRVLGCSKVTYKGKGNNHNIQVLCNYSPAGNILGMPIYHLGKGCDGNLKPNANYTSLCGEITILTHDRDPTVASIAGRIIIETGVLIFTLAMYCIA